MELVSPDILLGGVVQESSIQPDQCPGFTNIIINNIINNSF